MNARVLLFVASLMFLADQSRADPGGQPNRRAKKKHVQPVELGQQRADEVRIIAIGGYRQENRWEAGER